MGIYVPPHKRNGAVDQSPSLSTPDRKRKGPDLSPMMPSFSTPTPHHKRKAMDQSPRPSLSTTPDQKRKASPPPSMASQRRKVADWSPPSTARPSKTNYNKKGADWSAPPKAPTLRADHKTKGADFSPAATSKGADLSMPSTVRLSTAEPSKGADLLSKAIYIPPHKRGNGDQKVELVDKYAPPDGGKY